MKTKEPTKLQQKYKRRNRLKEQRKHKPHASLKDKKGNIIPISDRCIKCGKNTKHHHYYCDSCHKEKPC